MFYKTLTKYMYYHLANEFSLKLRLCKGHSQVTNNLRLENSAKAHGTINGNHVSFFGSSGIGCKRIGERP